MGRKQTRQELENLLEAVRGDKKRLQEELTSSRRDYDILKDKLTVANRFIDLFEKIVGIAAELAKKGKLPGWLLMLMPSLALAGAAVLALV